MVADEHGRAVQPSRVLHVIAADQITLVADTTSHLAFRGQQQPRVLQTATSDDEMLRRNPVSSLARGHDVKAADDGRVRVFFDLDDTSIEIDLDVGRPGQQVQIVLAETERPGHQENRRVQIVIVKRGSEMSVPCDDAEIIVGGHLQNPAGARVKGLELRVVERPAAVGHPRPCLEVERIHWPQAEPPAPQATPPIAGAAER
jgi:hypothetical protein